MKKLITISLMICLAVVFVSANNGIGNSATIVGGTIYEGVIENVISGASINVTCNGTSLDSVSDVEGEYSVSFASNDCGCGDSVSVAVKNGGGLVGSEVGSITMCGISPVPSLTLDIGIVNVPLVPEFGFFVGMLTILSAVGIFFIVRKD